MCKSHVIYNLYNYTHIYIYIYILYPSIKKTLFTRTDPGAVMDSAILLISRLIPRGNVHRPTGGATKTIRGSTLKFYAYLELNT